VSSRRPGDEYGQQFVAEEKGAAMLISRRAARGATQGADEIVDVFPSRGRTGLVDAEKSSSAVEDVFQGLAGRARGAAPSRRML